MISYRNILLFLYVLGFLSYGLKYLLGPANTTTNLISLTPFLLIILSRLLVVAATGWKRIYRIIPRSKLLGLVLLHFLLTLIARVKSDLYGLPGSTLVFGLSSFAVYFIPFLASLIVMGYAKKFKWKTPTPLQLISIGLGILFLANVVGYFLGIRPPGHYFEGRVNLPLMGGIYPGANLTAMVFLLCFGYFRFISGSLSSSLRYAKQALPMLIIAIVFGLSAYILLGANSRITILVVLFVVMLSIYHKWLLSKQIFFISFFTLPILLNSGYLLYYILSQPFFTSILQRVDYQDIITFHGRSYLWERLFEWMFYMRDGVIFGNGFKGYYFLDLMSDIGAAWYGGAKKSHNIHLHSSFGEVIISQGVVGFVIYAMILKNIFSYLKSMFYHNKYIKTLSLVFMFLLFMFQIDSFVHLDALGSITMAFLSALIIIRPYDSDD